MDTEHEKEKLKLTKKINVSTIGETERIQYEGTNYILSYRAKWKKTKKRMTMLW